jgi:hypothetical protein
LHLEDDGCAQTERDGRQQLVGDAEQRPERVDAAERIEDDPSNQTRFLTFTRADAPALPAGSSWTCMSPIC